MSIYNSERSKGKAKGRVHAKAQREKSEGKSKGKMAADLRG